jgi:hypothetical protein
LLHTYLVGLVACAFALFAQANTIGIHICTLYIAFRTGSLARTAGARHLQAVATHEERWDNERRFAFRLFICLA